MIYLVNIIDRFGFERTYYQANNESEVVIWLQRNINTLKIKGKVKIEKVSL